MKIALLHLTESLKEKYPLDYYGRDTIDGFEDVKTALLSFHNIPTHCFQVFSHPKEKLSLEFPLIVKSLREDDSVGIKEDCVVKTEERLREKAAFMKENYRHPALAEELIEDWEINVGISRNTGHTILPLSKI